MKRIPKSFEHQVHSLKAQLRILRGALQHTETDDIYYYKVIAGVLRVLVWEGRNNTPLLIDIARQMGLNMSLTLNELRNVNGEIDEIPVEYTLEEYLEKPVCSVQGEAISRIRLIRMVAEQDGLAHEDKIRDEIWPHVEIMYRDTPYFIHELKLISKDILDLGIKVVNYYEERKKEK